MIKKETTEIKKLAQKKHRLEQNRFVAEGSKAVEEIIAAGFQLVKAFISHKEQLNGLPASCRYEVISEDEMSRLSFLQTPTPILALFALPAPLKHYAIEKDELTLVLDNIQDPGNLGTIIRLADWFGVRTIACSKNTVDCYNPKVVQSTMGAVARVQVTYQDLEPILSDAKNRGIQIYGTFMEGKNIYTEELTPTGVLIMGNEGSGISEALQKHITRRLTIPPFKTEYVESLNVAIATSICCSEFRRRAIF